MSASGSDNALSPWDPRWTAADGSSWRLRLAPDLVEFRSDELRMSVPREHWSGDLLIAQTDDAVIVRLETFERSLVFRVTPLEARPFLKHIGHLMEADAAAPAIDKTPRAPRSPELLWPKVSPIAVWALLFGALAFLPVAGALFGVACAALLVLHRVRVRRAAAYAHSRMLCVAAFVLLVTGLAVSTIGTLGLVDNLRAHGKPESAPVLLRQGSARPMMEMAPRSERLGAARPGSIEGTIEPLESSNTRKKTDCAPSPRRTEERGFTNAVAAPPLAQSHLADTNWALVAATLLVVLLSLTVHEAAHAISAWWLGDDFAKRLGRVTLNPMAHVDPFGTVVLPLLLFLAGAGVFGWAKPVPVRLDHVPRPRRAQILIALAGPGSNLLLACLSLSMLLGIASIVPMLGPEAELSGAGLSRLDDMATASGFALAPVVGPACTILRISFFANVFLACFNLIPIPPLDGSWVLQHSFPRTLGPLYERMRPYAFLIFVGLLYTNVLDIFLKPAAYAAGFGLALVTLCTGS